MKAAVKRVAAGEPFRFDITGMPWPRSRVLSPDDPDSGGHQNTTGREVPRQKVSHGAGDFAGKLRMLAKRRT
jgi:hypothetical protein